MNTDIINLSCDQWTRETWQEAYNLYCQSNMYGQMTKREYYEFVKSRHQKIKENDAPLSAELCNKWVDGFNAAAKWVHKLNLKQEPIIDLQQIQTDVDDLKTEVAHITNEKIK